MSAKHFLKGATLGALLASTAALLFAPQRGTKTRKEALKLVGTFTKKLTSQAGEIKKLSKAAYDELVTETVADYSKGKKVAQESYGDIVKILKSNWTEIKKVMDKK